MTEIENLRAELWRLRALAAKVCWFDWSENDPDAVAAIDDLRKALKLKVKPNEVEDDMRDEIPF